MDDKKYDMYDTIEVRGVLPSPRASELSCGHHSRAIGQARLQHAPALGHAPEGAGTTTTVRVGGRSSGPRDRGFRIADED